MRHRLLLLCLLISGACGLAYELLWVRLLSLAFGSTTLSLSAVVAVFFGGLALGAWVAGRRAAVLARPIRVYAWIEIATGVLGVLLLPLLQHLDGLVAVIDPGPGLWGALVRFAVMTPLLIVPTMLMGATLPVICRAMLASDRKAGRGVALIYGANTLGAALGAYAVTFHVLPALGVTGAVIATALLNVTVGAVALILDRGTDALGAGNDSPSVPTALPAHVIWPAIVMTFLAGFAFIAYEIIWARVFSSILNGTIYGVGAVLICFLVGIGLGSMLIARWKSDRIPIGAVYAALQAVTIVAVLAMWGSLPFLAQLLRSLGTSSQTALVSLHVQLVVVLMALVVPTACSGASLPLLVRLIESRARGTGRALGSLYAANTVGSILGAVVTGFVVLPWLGSAAALWLGTGCVAAGGLVGGVVACEGRTRLVAIVAVLGAVGLAVQQHGFSADQLARALAPTGGGGAPVYFGEGQNATVAVYRNRQRSSMHINGLPQGSRFHLPPRESLEGVLTALVPLAHTTEPGNALVIGLGTGQTVQVLDHFGLERITVVELEHKVIEAVNKIYPEKSPLQSERVRLEIEDARHYLLRCRGRGDFGLISSMPFHPWAAPSLFTREFFELAAANLSPTGIFSTWCGLSVDSDSIHSLLRAFCSVFEHYAVYYVPQKRALFLVGSPAPLTLDPSHLESLHANPMIRVHPELQSSYFLAEHLVASGDADTPAPPAGVVNTDDSAFLEVHGPRSKQIGVATGLLAREHLLPSMVPEAVRRDFFRELIERLLGTPNGRLPIEQRAPRIAAAQRTLDAAHAVLDQIETAYFSGRIALGRGNVDHARTLFEQTRTVDGPIAARAAKFHAICERSPTARLEALAALEPESDVLLAMMEIDRQRALTHVPFDDVDPRRDALGWLLRRVARPALGVPDTVDGRTFVRFVGPALARTDRPLLLTELERFSARHGLARIAEMYSARRHAVSAEHVERLLRRGRAALSRGSPGEAANALWSATRVAPRDERVMVLLLNALAILGDDTRAEQYLSELRCLGESRERLIALWEAALSDQSDDSQNRTAGIDTTR